MYFSLEQQLLTLAQAFGLGVVIGVVYEIFRIWRRFCPSQIAEFVRDFIFIVGTVLFSSWFYIRTSWGQIRWFYVLAQLLGAVLFHKLIGRFCFEVICKFLAWLFGGIKFLLCQLFRPILWLLHRVLKFLQKVVNIIFKKLFIFIKKYIIIFTYPLFHRKMKKSKERTANHGEKSSEAENQKGYSQFYH